MHFELDIPCPRLGGRGVDRHRYDVSTMAPEIVTIAIFHTPLEGALAKNFLEAEGVLAFVANEASVLASCGVSEPAVAIELQVAQKDAERAREILSRFRRID